MSVLQDRVGSANPSSWLVPTNSVPSEVPSVSRLQEVAWHSVAPETLAVPNGALPTRLPTFRYEFQHAHRSQKTHHPKVRRVSVGTI